MINQGNNIYLVKSGEKICVYRKNYVPLQRFDRDLAQLVAHTSGGREVAGSSPVIPTKSKGVETNRFQLLSFFINYLADCIVTLCTFRLENFR